VKVGLFGSGAKISGSAFAGGFGNCRGMGIVGVFEEIGMSGMIGDMR